MMEWAEIKTTQFNVKITKFFGILQSSSCGNSCELLRFEKKPRGAVYLLTVFIGGIFVFFTRLDEKYLAPQFRRGY